MSEKKEKEKADIKVEMKAEDLDKTKKIIEEQLTKLDINEIITNTLSEVILPIVKETLEQIDTIEIEGKRVRVKFK